MWIARTFLIIVAVVYVALAIWCTAAPATTSKKVGLGLVGGAGKSEFMTVYGGLEFGLALIFAAAAWRTDTIVYGLIACTLLHASVALFRTVSLFKFEEIESFTYRLAACEWGIAIVGGILLAVASWPSNATSS